MEKSANTITRFKFTKLSFRGRHKLFAALAKATLEDGQYAAFWERYNELHAWVDSDRYVPPNRLTAREAVVEARLFHQALAGTLTERFSGRLPEQKLTWQPRFPVEVAVDQIHSPFNVGSILRLIDNFGFSRLVHGTAGLRLDHPQLRKAARGCETWIPTLYVEDLFTYLSDNKGPVIGLETEPGATPVSEWEPPQRCVLLLGNEIYGISQALRRRCDRLVTIPMFGFKKSMNLHHALAIAANRLADKYR